MLIILLYLEKDLILIYFSLEEGKPSKSQKEKKEQQKVATVQKQEMPIVHNRLNI